MKCYIIRLADNEFSCRIAGQCVEQATKFGLAVELFNGVTGPQADLIFESDGIQKYPQKLKKNTAGIKGCAASHYLLWKKCVQDNEPYLILEQDAYMIRSLPDFVPYFSDICKLDSCDPFSPEYEQHITQDQGAGIKDYNLSWGFKRHSAPYGGYFRGAWAYIIKPQAAQKCVESFQQQGWVPADKQFGCELLDLKASCSTIFRIHPEYTAENIEALSLTRNLK
jgi:glycosyl transferase family 25